MNATTRHRGPDDTGTLVTERVSLGANRLSIIDLSEAGHQPMKYEAEGRVLWIVYNGEIYNFQELRDELVSLGLTFESKSDTEVILASFFKWGFDCVKKFVGMWAFCIYDEKNSQLFLSRDNNGIKPLYYYLDSNHLVFSSEIKGIFVHDIPRIPNEGILFDYLFYNLIDHKEDTFFQSIKRIMPGNNALYDLNSKKMKVWRYEDWEERVKDVKTTPEDKVEEFRELFTKAVQFRLISDVPIGTCLSGGIDSSSITCCMRELMPRADIKTFSLVFPGLPIDESSYQEAVVKAANAQRFTISFNADDLLADLEDFIKTQEEPFIGLSIYSHYKVMELANQNSMKVLIDGQGADEMLAGYDYFASFYGYELLRKLRLGTLVNELWKFGNGPKRKTFRNFVGLLLPTGLKRSIFLREKRYLSKPFVERHLHEQQARFKRSGLNESLMDAMENYPLPALLRYEDKNSMRWSIESRVPFVDPQLIAYCASLESKQKIRNGKTKFILREAMEPIIPKIVLERRDKIGFGTPDRLLAQSGAAKELIESILASQSFQQRPYWNSQIVSEQYARKGYVGSNIFSGDELWRLIIVELWLRIWIEQLIESPVIEQSRLRITTEAK